MEIISYYNLNAAWLIFKNEKLILRIKSVSLAKKAYIFFSVLLLQKSLQSMPCLAFVEYYFLYGGHPISQTKILSMTITEEAKKGKLQRMYFKYLE